VQQAELNNQVRVPPSWHSRGILFAPSPKRVVLIGLLCLGVCTPNLAYPSSFLTTPSRRLLPRDTVRNHKMSFAEAPAPVFTAADLLAFDESQLVRYLESNRRVDGGFDIWITTGLESLSKSQKDELGSRLR
jgi:hypothetical protein